MRMGFRIAGIVVVVVLTMLPAEGMAAAKKANAKKRAKNSKVAKAKKVSGTWTMVGKFGDPIDQYVMFHPGLTKPVQLKGKDVWSCHCNKQDLKAAVARFAKNKAGFPKTVGALLGKPVRIKVTTALEDKGNALRFDKGGRQKWVSIELLPEKAE